MDAEQQILPGHLQLFDECRKSLQHEWSRLRLTKFSIHPYGGGMSNNIYKCTIPDEWKITKGVQRTAILRVYGKHATQDTLLKFSTLSERGIGPKLFGTTEGAQIEDFIQSDCLKVKDIRSCATSKEIARTLYAFHSLDVPFCKQPDLLEKLSRWTEECKQILNEDWTGHPKLELINKLKLVDYKQKLEIVRNLVSDVDSEAVFCHNDVHPGNIMPFGRNGLKIIFIDIEFAGYNYRGFDICNHFVQWCFDYDTKFSPQFQYTPENFPDLIEQDRFLKSYLKASNDKSATSKRNRDALSTEVRAFVPAVHLFWALWGIKLFKNIPPGSLFGYLEYSDCRVKAFDKWVSGNDMLQTQS